MMALVIEGGTTLTRPQGILETGGDAPRGAPYVRWVFAEASSARLDAVVEIGAALEIGRAPDGGLAVGDDGWLSRRHARLVPRTGGEPGVVVEDLGSRNGTFVDGRRITERTVAPLGAVLQIGGSLFVVGQADPEPLPVPPPGDFSCRSWAMRQLWRRVLRLADSDQPVLLLGEMGTGKTRVARLLHQHSARRDGPFVCHNCSALPVNLEEATLFGVVGGFIPSVKEQAGLLTRARGGTLFLDELADLPAPAQAKLLDAFDPLDAGYLPVGGAKRLRTECRLVSATNRDVFALAASGALRHDLLSRMVVGQLVVPPLRARREDLLAMFGAALAAAGVTAPVLRDVEGAQAVLLSSWVENVRGLETLARRVALGEAPTPAMVKAHAERGTGAPAPIPAPAPSAAPAPAAAPMWPPSPEELLAALAAHDFNVSDTAAVLGRRRETVSRLVSATFGGRAAVQRAWRVWQASGRAPRAGRIDPLFALFCEGPRTPEADEARRAWIERGEA
jgi:transcriptional regulator with AAA-type ATPase domain